MALVLSSKGLSFVGIRLRRFGRSKLSKVDRMVISIAYWTTEVKRRQGKHENSYKTMFYYVFELFDFLFCKFFNCFCKIAFDGLTINFLTKKFDILIFYIRN